MNKKILTAVIGIVVVAVLGGLVYYFQGGNLKGFMAPPKATKKTVQLVTCPTVAKTVYSYTTQTGDSQEFEYKSFNELFKAIKTELQANGGKPSCPYRFNFSEAGADFERTDQVICGDKDNLLAVVADGGARYLSCTRQFGNVQVAAQISDLPEYGFLIDLFYDYGNNGIYGSAMEKIRAQGIRVERFNWNFL